MRKYIIFLIGMVVLFLAVAYVKLFAKQTQYQQSIVASTSPVLVLNNFDKSTIKIVTADTDKITYDLKGAAQDLVNLLQSEGGDVTGMGGTITVPKGMLLDVSLSGSGKIDVNDAAGKKTINNKDSFLIDTTNLNSFGVGNFGNVVLDGWGNLVVWDDKKWELLSNLPDSGDGPASDNGTAQGDRYCGIGSQVIRNYCCGIREKDTVPPVCSGTGHWIFDNSARDCAYSCEIPQSGGNESVDEEIDCSVGAQATRNNCCAAQFAGQYQGCIGSWNYNNAARKCAFVCSNTVPTEGGDSGQGGAPPPLYGDPTSNFCAGVVEASDKDVCCNNALKNNLSSGPHPGYPDCIGNWYFDINAGCRFRCAEYIEMMRILEEIRQKAQN